MLKYCTRQKKTQYKSKKHVYVSFFNKVMYSDIILC